VVPVSAPAVPQSNSYEVRRGDALILIAKRYGRTVAQLKAANGLKDDMIHIGQALHIPTLEECIALGLPPEPAPIKRSPADTLKAPPDLDREVLLLQVFLDREKFSAGPIDGKNSPSFQKLVYLYQANRDGEPLLAKAQSAVRSSTASYRLREGDFRFIAPPKAEKSTAEKKPAPTAGKKKSSPEAPAKIAPVYAEMTSVSMLAYHSPWEFVAERFHCDEKLLKSLNPGIKPFPPAGTEFQVPNVVPFEIERALAPPLQPLADPARVITAWIVDVSRIEIYSNAELLAILPISPARPGLHGRGAWSILDAIARPKLATTREPKDPPKPVSSFFTGENPPPPSEVLAAEEFLPAGPNNPAGIIWINLAKAGSPEILPFGLHGTSIPSGMNTLASIGGFRMPNWDIARAVRLLPAGTALNWKQSAAPAPAPPAK
jgi:LysM repeat protein